MVCFSIWVIMVYYHLLKATAQCLNNGAHRLVSRGTSDLRTSKSMPQIRRFAVTGLQEKQTTSPLIL
jgi:hypothetical protein